MARPSLPNPADAAAPGRDVGRERRGVALGLLAAFIWGGYIAVTHQGVDAGLSAADLAWLRYSIAGLVLLPWLLRHRPMSLAGVGWGRSAILALLAGPPFVLVGASGFYFAPLAHSAVIQLGMATLAGMVLAALLARERQGGRRMAGLAIVVAGLAITAGPGLLGEESGAWRGDLLFAAAGVMWALFTVLQRRWSLDPLSATAAVSVLSGAVFTPVYLAWRGPAAILGADPWVVLQQGVMLGLLSGVVALFAFARAVEDLGPGRASLFPALAPGVAIAIGIPLSQVWPTPLQILGVTLLSGGLVFAVTSRKPHPVETRHEPEPAA